MTADRYPWRGLGLSSNLSAADQPHPYRLLDAEPGLFDFVEYSAPLDVEEARAQASLFEEMWRRRAEVPVLFHPVHLNLFGPALEAESLARAAADHARAVGSAWIGNDIGWWHAGGHAFPGYLYLSPPLEEGAVEDAVRHAVHVQRAFGEVPLLLENPVVMARRGPMHVLDFMRAVSGRSGCDLLIDVGHLWSHQLVRGLPSVDEAFDRFPWERVIEVHVAGGVATSRGERRFYVDDHTQPVREELFDLLRVVLPRCTNLRALTFEGDGHPEAIAARTLRRLREWIPRRDVGTETPGSAADAPGGGAIQARSAGTSTGAASERGMQAGAAVGAGDAAMRTDAWALFREVHGHGAGEDGVGTEAEVDFRLAVVAERLDAEWPLTRLLVCGTREALLRFVASEDYGTLFTEPRADRDLAAAFGGFARRACMTRETAPAAAVLALETWVRGQHRQQEHGVLAPGIFTGTFAADLSEVVFAAQALRRHLAGRAWASGLLETSSLDALMQVAARAPMGRWPFVARRTATRSEVLSVDPELVAAVHAIAGGSEIAPHARDAAIRAGLVRSSERASWVGR